MRCQSHPRLLGTENGLVSPPEAARCDLMFEQASHDLANDFAINTLNPEEADLYTGVITRRNEADVC